MVYLVGFLLFLAVAAVTWAVAVALFVTFLGGPDLRRRPDFYSLSAVPVGVVAVTSLFPFPTGYLLSLVVWWLAAWGQFGLPAAQAVRPFLTLAALSVVSRLVLLGVLAL